MGHLLALATGVAVAEVLEEAFGLHGRVALKWPNDVLLEGKKVCGILLEASADAERIFWAVAGIGLNVNSEPSTFRGVAAREPWRRNGEGRPLPVSLKEHLGHPVPRAPLLAALLARLTCWWTGLDRAGTAPGLLAEWRRRDALVGRRVEVFAGPDRSRAGRRRDRRPASARRGSCWSASRRRDAHGGVRRRRQRDGVRLTAGKTVGRPFDRGRRPWLDCGGGPTREGMA